MRGTIGHYLFGENMSDFSNNFSVILRLRAQAFEKTFCTAFLVFKTFAEKNLCPNSSLTQHNIHYVYSRWGYCIALYTLRTCAQHYPNGVE